MLVPDSIDFGKLCPDMLPPTTIAPTPTPSIPVPFTNPLIMTELPAPGGPINPTPRPIDVSEPPNAGIDPTSVPVLGTDGGK